MMSAIAPISQIDRQTENVLRFLENMPDRTTCESYILAGFNGWHFPPCPNKPVVGDLETEFDLCATCWNKYQRGEFDAFA